MFNNARSTENGAGFRRWSPPGTVA